MVNATSTPTHRTAGHTRRRLLAGIAAGLAVTAVLVAVGPRPLNPSGQATGDADLAEVLTAHAGRGHHELAAMTLADGQARFAGLGADERTEAEIGSVTKTFTAELMRQLIEEGVVTEETTVAEILPDRAAGSPIADVTLRELADHTSGLPRLGSDHTLLGSLVSQATRANPYEGTSGDDVVADALATEPSGRGESSYSNFGVALLGELLARAAGTTYPALLQERILTPLHMDSTYLMSPGTVPADAPRGHAAGGREAEPWEMDGYAPAGALRSTAADMAVWADHLLKVGLPDYTWVHEQDHAWHNGGTGGYSSMLVVDPESRTAAFVVGDTVADVDGIGTDLLREVRA